jgi:thiosulfate dehydrogenase [quinone] large subunit
MKSDIRVKLPGWGRWALVPLRLFMGATFVYAGVQKLSDPQYFDPRARGYIGHQIMAFATGSPLQGFLTRVAVPHAVLFGALVAYGELAIGLGVLLGLLLRVASLCGLLVNLVFFLSADWHVFPYFYGSDIVFCFCWLTLLLAGPANQALPALDTRLVLWLVERARPASRPRLATLCALVFGVQVGPVPAAQPAPVAPGSRIAQPRPQAVSGYKVWQLEQARQESRRSFIWGAASGGILMILLVGLAEALRLLPAPSPTDASDLGTPVTPTLGSPVAGDTPTATLPGGVIAKISDVPVNSSVSFTIPSNGDPGILVHLSNGQFVAFDATCTHAGCPVDYDPGLHDLVCPCHGAAFDPSKGAAVINGPAQTPLTSVPIVVDQNAGTISLGQ